MKPYKWVMFFGFFTVVLPVAMELTVPRLLQVMIDDGILVSDIGTIVRASLLMFAAALVGAAATLAQGFARAHLSQGLAFDMRRDLFNHVQSFSFGNLDQMQTGQLMTRLSSDVDMVRLFSSAGLALLLRALLMITGSLVMLIIMDWQLSIIMLLVLAVSAGLIRWIIMIANPLFTLVQQKLSTLNTRVQENLAGVHLVKAFVREKFEIDRFEEQNVEYMAQNIRVGRLLALALPILVLLTNLGSVAVVWFGGLNVINEHLSIGELVAFNSYLMIGMAPLMLLGNVLTMVARAEVSAGRVLEVLDTESLVRAPATPHRPATVQGRVDFENVSFRYRDAADLDLVSDHQNGLSQNGTGRERVLDSVSFSVQPGQQVALLGATGAGKSTLVNLIPRFYDPGRGRIRIDGEDVRDWEPAQLRSRIGMVLQQNTLFSGTVRENIAYGKADATLEEVVAAARAAQAHDFIVAMPEGYDSIVEARGANLSGGQKQRIAIARALLISPGILILDDSTSAVDMETEFKIQQELDTLMAGKTTFVIAQRITSVINADQILILDEGRITASGTHRDLLRTSPIYREIYESQLGEHLAEADQGHNGRQAVG